MCKLCLKLGMNMKGKDLFPSLLNIIIGQYVFFETEINFIRE